MCLRAWFPCQGEAITYFHTFDSWNTHNCSCKSAIELSIPVDKAPQPRGNAFGNDSDESSQRVSLFSTLLYKFDHCFFCIPVRAAKERTIDGFFNCVQRAIGDIGSDFTNSKDITIDLYSKYTHHILYQGSKGHING